MDFLLQIIGSYKKEKTMHNIKILLPAFILVALVQLFVPAKMIWDKEKVIAIVKEYKFETVPIDPTDPFRGKYVVLRYKENSFYVDNISEWKKGDKIYVLLKEDENGFAKIESVSKEKPLLRDNYVKAKVGHLSNFKPNKLNIDYPFNRFYMEESKAYAAEQLYRKFQRDSSIKTYGSVSIKNGESVLKDVIIDGMSLKEAVKENRIK